MDNYKVLPIKYDDVKPFILNIHYAKRLPSISYSFGLFYYNSLVGIITYGLPPSQTLCKSILGDKYKDIVLELNRLVLKNNKKNEASFLISNSIKLLPKPKVIVSFADANMDHSGYVYQATNFLYTGSSSNEYQYVFENGKEFHFRNFGHYQKNNRLNVKLIKRRKNEHEINKIEIANFLRKNKKDFKNKDLDIAFNKKDTAAHWFRLDAGFSFPNIDDWFKLKKILKFDETYDKIMGNYELVPDRAEIIKKLKLIKKPIKQKHRYIYIVADKKNKKKLLTSLKLTTLKYPKFQNKNYLTDTNIQTQGILI